MALALPQDSGDPEEGPCSSPDWSGSRATPFPEASWDRVTESSWQSWGGRRETHGVEGGLLGPQAAVGLEYLPNLSCPLALFWVQAETKC